MKFATTEPRGSTQQTLFAEPPPCTAPGCEAGDRKNLCKHDADQARGLDYRPRPRGCIISFQLAPDEPLPF